MLSESTEHLNPSLPSTCDVYFLCLSRDPLDYRILPKKASRCWSFRHALRRSAGRKEAEAVVSPLRVTFSYFSFHGGFREDLTASESGAVYVRSTRVYQFRLVNKNNKCRHDVSIVPKMVFLVYAAFTPPPQLFLADDVFCQRQSRLPIHIISHPIWTTCRSA